ncbi:MAG: ATP-grasp domain-containing protein, partial [Candidatus Nanohaloarchaea archaeon]
LFFEPLTVEDVANVVETTGADRVATQFGGQTSVNLTVPLQEYMDRHGIDAEIAGTAAGDMDAVEDRELFAERLDEMGIPQPDSGTATSLAEAERVADEIGYPLLVRPSYVIGGRAMRVVDSEDELEQYMEEAVAVSPDRPVYLDRFLQDGTELDIDAVSDGDDVLIGGVMEHIEPAGVHSGDSACVLPPQDVPSDAVETATEYVRRIARAFDIQGFLNVQLAVVEEDGEHEVYVLEANPRASRTIPFVSKHADVPLARIAARVMMGAALDDIDTEPDAGNRVSVKEVVLPFDRLPGSDPSMSLGPEMKSTGEVMGIATDFPTAYYKAQVAAGNALPRGGSALVVAPGTDVADTVDRLRDIGFDVDIRDEPDVDFFRHEYDLIVDLSDTSTLKRKAYDENTPYVSTVQAFDAAVRAIDAVQDHEPAVAPVDQDR